MESLNQPSPEFDRREFFTKMTKLVGGIAASSTVVAGVSYPIVKQLVDRAGQLKIAEVDNFNDLHFNEQLLEEMRRPIILTDPNGHQPIETRVLNMHAIAPGVEWALTSGGYFTPGWRSAGWVANKRPDIPILVFEPPGRGPYSYVTTRQTESLRRGEGFTEFSLALHRAIDEGVRLPGHHKPVKIEQANYLGYSMAASFGSVFLNQNSPTQTRVSVLGATPLIDEWVVLAHQFVFGDPENKWWANPVLAHRLAPEDRPALESNQDTGMSVLDLGISSLLLLAKLRNIDPGFVFSRAIAQTARQVPNNLSDYLDDPTKSLVFVHDKEDPVCPMNLATPMAHHLQEQAGDRMTEVVLNGGHQLPISWSDLVDQYI